MRIEDGAFKRVETDTGGFLHRVGEAVRLPPPKQPEPRRLSIGELCRAQSRYQKNVEHKNRQIGELALGLGVDPGALVRLGVGQDDKGVWTFPMYDDARRVVGIRKRTWQGKKWAEPGSQNGLFIARERLTDPVIVCEGPTDTAAAMTLGYSAVGRPMAKGRVPWLVSLLSGHRVIIVADADGVGLDGADSLAIELFWSCPLVRLFVPTGKDLRVMLANEGDRFIRNAIECSRVFSYDEAIKA